MNSNLRGWLWPAAMGALLATTAATEAQTVCVHPPVSVPALSGLPKWMPETAGDNDYRVTFNDPRWAGDPLKEFACSYWDGGTSPANACGLNQEDVTELLAAEGRFRMVHEGEFVSVSMQAWGDPNGYDANDRAFFAFTQGSAGVGGHALSIALGEGAAIPAPSTSGTEPAPPTDGELPHQLAEGFVQYWRSTNLDDTNNGWVEQAAAPGWLHDVALWTLDTGGWGATFRIKMSGSASANVAGDFKMFVGTLQDHGASGNVHAVTSSQVGGSAPLDGFITRDPDSAGSLGWREVSALGTPCTDGFTIARANIGAVDAAGDITSSLSTSGANTFRVRPGNFPAGAAGDHAVRTRIRLAKWGSQIAHRKFAPWEDIGTEVAFTAPSLSAPQWDWSNPDGSGLATIEFTCALGGEAFCPIVDATTHDDHQCILAELASAPGTNYPVSTGAVYRNMNFDGLSTDVDEATISIEGLKQLTGLAKDRDVFVYVQALNMPAHGEQALALPRREMELVRRFSVHPPALEIPAFGERVVRRQGNLKARSDSKLSRYVEKQLTLRGKRATEANELYSGEDGLPSIATAPEQALDGTWPTYRIRVYYDTGNTLTVKGETKRVVRPMLPFGKYYDHEGPLYGFSHALTGLDGVELEEVGPNYYRMHLPSEGSARVQMRVTAEEKPASAAQGCKPEIIEKVVIKKVRDCTAGPASGGAGGWLLASLLLLGTAVMVRRRRDRR